MHDPIETAELVAFTKTVEAKSLSRAAAKLGVPRATISRRLARLEERLSTRLLRRTTRSLALTDAGEAFYRHACMVLDAVSQAEASVRQTDSAVRGMLRVSLPPLSDRSFYALLCDFATRYPEVRLQLHFSSHYVDLKRDGYDVALRASSQLEPGLVARTLARGALMAVAAPAYLAKNGTPKTSRDLRNHRCLLGFARGELPQTHWPRAGSSPLHVEGSFCSNDITLLCEAAVRGLGIALLPSLVVDPLFHKGELVQVLPGIIEAETRVSAVYLERQFVSPQVRAFVDMLAAWAPTALVLQGRAVRVPATPPGKPAPPARRARPRVRADR